MLSFILTSSPDECQSKSFEKMNTLLIASFKNLSLYSWASAAKVRGSCPGYGGRRPWYRYNR